MDPTNSTNPANSTNNANSTNTTNSPVGRPARIRRRTLLAAGATAAALSTAAPTAAAAGGAVAELERRHHRRIGVYAQNLATGRMLTHRPNERFALCSTFKTLAVAAVLDGRLITPDRRVLERRAYYPPSLVDGSGYGPRLGAWLQQGYAPTVAEICAVTLADSDNAGANWLLQLIGGPDAVTALARDLGDRRSTLTRWEPALNEWSPGDTADATTPAAIAGSYARLLLGDALGHRARSRLVRWMLRNRTGDDALRAGLPRDWRIAEKTGSGAYGSRNDVGVAWTGDGSPVLISCLTRGSDVEDETTDAPLADVAKLCARELG